MILDTLLRYWAMNSLYLNSLDNTNLHLFLRNDRWTRNIIKIRIIYYHNSSIGIVWIIRYYKAPIIIFFNARIWKYRINWHDQYWQIAYQKFLVAQNFINKDLKIYLFYLRKILQFWGKFYSTALVLYTFMSNIALY